MKCFQNIIQQNSFLYYLSFIFVIFPK